MTDTASVAADVGTVKRALQMNMFATKKDHDEVASKNGETFRATEEGRKLFSDDKAEDGTPLGLGANGKFTKTLGQIVGQIFEVQDRKGQLRDGTPTESLIAVGEFEAANYATGEVMESYTAYLPRYFLETCKAALASGNVKAIPFAVEIVLTPTGKTIPTAYEIRNLMRKRPQSVVNQIKQELAGMNRLRLSAPIAAPSLAQLGIEDASGLPPVEGDPEAAPEDGGDPNHVPEGDVLTPEGAAEGAEAGAEAAKGRKGRQAAE